MVEKTIIEKIPIINLPVHHLDFRQSLEIVIDWAEKRRPSYVCFANVHMTMEAYRDSSFLEQVRQADLVLADGKPIAMAFNLLHHVKQERIAGMDFLPRVLELAGEKKISVFLYGSAPDVQESFRKRIASRFPGVHFAGAISPPFWQLSIEEEMEFIESIKQSGAQIVFVALGCPRQEKWMADNYKKINAVLLGIGGAVPVLAGKYKRAPRWMQNLSLEWFYRMLQQPRRLFKRYTFTNIYFLLLLTREWLKKRVKK